MSEPLLDYTEKHRTPILLFCAASFFFTQFLFFIDEGYYSFQWMQEPGAWFVFLLYWLPIVLCMYRAWNLLSNKNLISKITFSVLIGLFTGISLVIVLLLGWKEINGF